MLKKTILLKLKFTALNRTNLLSLMLLLSLMFSIAACRKDDHYTGEEQTAMGHDPQISSYRKAEAKLAYSLFTPAEKYDAWLLHFEQFGKAKELNKLQAQYINELSSFITPGLFAMPIAPGEDEQLTYLKNKASRLFTKADVIQLLTSLESFEGKEAGGGCDCNKSEDYCPGVLVCGATSCAASEDGCGTFWMYSCNGKCR